MKVKVQCKYKVPSLHLLHTRVQLLNITLLQKYHTQELLEELHYKNPRNPHPPEPAKPG